MNKTKRQRLLLDIISKNEVDTQEDILALLLENGLQVTQATVSRDINELGLVKTAGFEKKYRYVLPDNGKNGGKNAEMLRHAVRSVVRAMNTVVIKTIVGNGNAVAALIDGMNLEEVVGTIAGDDTVFAIAMSEQLAEKLEKTIKAML